MTVNAVVDERTLREIYLTAFETVVREAAPWTVMASYNRVNGSYATENQYLLRDILKDEWGYDGVVVSDWGAVHDTAAAANGGNDLEMPGPPRWFGAGLLAAVKSGEVPQAHIDAAAKRMVRLILRTGVLDGEQPPAGELRTRRHRDIAARAAEEAVVLLKNEGELLPLDTSALRRVAVVGPNAAVRRIQGGGSSQVRAARQISILQAVQDLLGGDCEVVHADGGDNEPVPPQARTASFSADPARGEAGLLCEYFADRHFAGAPYRSQVERGIGKLVAAAAMDLKADGLGAVRWRGWLWAEHDGRHELSLRAPGQVRVELGGRILIDGNTPGKIDSLDIGGTPATRRTAGVHLAGGQGYPIVFEYVRPTDPEALGWEQVGIGLRQPRGGVADAAALAATADAAIVVIGAASTSEAEGYDRETLDLPGNQNALVEAVLAANPRTVIVVVGGAPYAMPWIDHTPAVILPWLGGEEGPDALARILFGRAEPSGRLPVTFPRKLEHTPAHAWYPGGADAIYGEGLAIAATGTSTRPPKPPMFPFGHGLTYTRFVYAELDAPEGVRAGDPVRVAFTLRNVGERAGKETAQLYVRPRGPSVHRPVKELKGFAKVSLAPGRHSRVTLDLDARAFSFWDPARRSWIAEPGAYDLLIGGSAADIELQTTVRLEE